VYSERIILATYDDLERENGWRPQEHPIGEIEDFNERLSKYLEPTTTNAGTKTYWFWKDGKSPSESIVKYIRRFVENEQFCCFASAEYFVTRYGRIRDVEERVISFQYRLAQRIFHSALAVCDDQQQAIQFFILKARQLGVSTVVVLYFLHRLLFRANCYAVMASVQIPQSEKLAGMIEVTLSRIPFWLAPSQVSTKAKEPRWSNGSFLSVQAGAQTVGIAQGTTPTCCHCSEIGDYANPKKTFDEGLFPCCHPTPSLFLVLEGTGAIATPWQRETWDHSVKREGKGARFKPFFLPPSCAKDIYPPEGWLRNNPIPSGDWMTEETRRMKRRGELFVRSTDYLWKYLGQRWEMDKEFCWFWQCGFQEAVSKHAERQFLSQNASCITGDARISTEKGMVRLGEAKGVKNCESGKISNWINKGKRKIVELHTKDGRVLRGTPDHKILMAEGGWKCLGSLLDGDRISLKQNVFSEEYCVIEWKDTPLYSSSRVVDELVGRLFGYFMGDGCFYGNCLQVTCDAGDQDVIDDACSVIEKLIGKIPRVRLDRGCSVIRSENIGWLPFLKASGVVYQKRNPSTGNGNGWKRSVCVPECIFRSPKPVVRQFLSSLFECDGHAHKESARVSLASIHMDFLRGVQQLLMGFGIRSGLRESRRTGDFPGKKDDRVYWLRQLTIGAAFANKFYDEIGFTGKRKQGQGRRRDDINRLGRKVYSDLIDVVSDVSDTGEEEDVFDITTDTHEFSANGIVVHNCPDDCFQSENEPVFSKDVIEIVTKEQERKYVAYAITGRSILIGDENKPYFPWPGDVDDTRDRIPLHWEAADGNEYDWLLIPLKSFDDSIDESCFDKLLIFETPEPGAEYAVAADTAHGLNTPNEDRTSLGVHRKGNNGEPDVEVAAYTSIRVSSPQAARLMAAMAVLYGTDGTGNITSADPLVAKFIIEQVRKPGDECQHQLKIMGFLNHHIMHSYDSKGNIDPNKGTKEGWFTREYTRPILLDRFVEAVVHGWLILNDPVLVRQLGDLERKYKGEHGRPFIEHGQGKHDDNIFRAAMAWTTLHDFDNFAMRLENRNRPSKRKESVSDQYCQQLIAIE